ncbi:uncharacterized protein LOC111809120 [Cucurbita pepo subsp. pepo]|uniref:uncharacterized protein LOC111809120 n=1 Tax=Cucurbita pepo subsp. pepo TaxID=3664 RepID=UPI000C9D5A58|nr:uncharacterized protein LOC111809120 [Cucurbita pepo subsp. pepo]
MPLPASISLSPIPPTEPTTDDLAAVKAAAWAWYQHGSGSDSKPMREFGLTRPTTLPKPSRYRLEAIRRSQTPSLLDSYEVASISRRLSDLLDPTDRNNFSLRSFESELLDLGRQIERKPTKPKKFRTGLWRRRPSVMCGKLEDVVVGTLVHPPGKQPRRSTAGHDH